LASLSSKSLSKIARNSSASSFSSMQPARLRKYSLRIWKTLPVYPPGASRDPVLGISRRLSSASSIGVVGAFSGDAPFSSFRVRSFHAPGPRGAIPRRRAGYSERAFETVSRGENGLASRFATVCICRHEPVLLSLRLIDDWQSQKNRVDGPSLSNHTVWPSIS
jgi:hypothetical protein